ncbi:Nudix hydrolase 14, chloroplastic [Apostasia shenzhenica]|uniref:Nudix hydrolase 14, chloroplastic n=1 Tax=Apostasia shenzhenica TaxID=1088818 RepID=A0A2I0AR27_9ASPA|nr:Nudix hydrolase 14, chloroplastic [Apostasia shenzhenica]
MSACRRLLFGPAVSLHLNARHGLRCSHELRKPIYRRQQIRLFSRMASGDSQACRSPTQTLTLKSGDSVEIIAASGLSDSDLRNAVDSTLFKQWLKNMQSERGLLADGKMRLRCVEIQAVDMFGNRVGFLKFKAEVFDNQTGMKVPGIVFARGLSVAVLILLESEGETNVVLTEQVRVPVGKLILELPAGMVDDGVNLVGSAIREVEEETSINLNVHDMLNLTAFLDPTTGCKVFPSPVIFFKDPAAGGVVRQRKTTGGVVRPREAAGGGAASGSGGERGRLFSLLPASLSSRSSRTGDSARLMVGPAAAACGCRCVTQVRRPLLRPFARIGRREKETSLSSRSPRISDCRRTPGTAASGLHTS